MSWLGYAPARCAAAVSMALIACTAPVGVKRVSPEAAHEALTGDVLTRGRPSEVSRNVLRRHDLLGRFEDDPDGALAVLHALAVGETGGRRELYALAELSYLRAGETARTDQYLAAAVYAWAFLFPHEASELPTRFDPRSRVMCDVYNLAVAHAFVAGDDGQLELRGGAMPLPFGTLDVQFDPAALTWANRRLVDVMSTADLEVGGLRNRYRLAGLGAPAAARVAPLTDGEYDMIGAYARVPLTVLLRFDGVREALHGARLAARLEIHVQSEQEWAEVEGERVPLEFELTASLAAGLSESEFWKLELRRFFGRLSGFQAESSLSAAAPHHEGTIPVVFVHGTASSPGRWADMVNDLWSERFMRQHFSVWVFSYDTGNPVAYSARALRRALRRAVRQADPEKRDPCLREMVVVGHSQGGLLTKMTAVDTGDRLWRGVARRPFEELQLPEKERQLIHEMMFLKPLPFVGRVVFIATPHGGSYQALRSISGLIAGFVSLPRQMLGLTRELVTLNPGAMRERLWGEGVPTSINDMTPGSAFQEALHDIQVVRAVPAHSIIPVLGEGPVEQGEDGVVKYRSAHVDGVASELVVRSGHSTQAEPDTIQEMDRILRLHVAELAAAGVECGRRDAGVFP